MSDIGILNDPLSLIAIALIFGSPGLLLGDDDDLFGRDE